MLLSMSKFRFKWLTTPMKLKFEWVHASREHVKRVHANIHQVQLGEDVDFPLALWVDGSYDAASSRELELTRSTMQLR
jgi:hypothetical protein